MTPSVRLLRRNLRDFSGKFSPSELDRLMQDAADHRVKGMQPRLADVGAAGKQLPPDDTDWRSWLILGGRGAGKTRAGAEWVKAQALGDWTNGVAQARRIAIVGPTLEQARSVMIEGKSGLLSIHMEAERPLYEPSKRLMTWPNGAIAQVFSADEPEILRGPQFDAAWCDELAKWRLGEPAWDMLTVGAGGYIGGRSLEKVADAVKAPRSAGFPFIRGSDRKG